MYEVRCLNCLKRVPVERGANKAICPHCKASFSIVWVTPTQPKIEKVLGG
ncbi:MAG: hypothetical protein QXK12_04520 [Candidatus Nezhaarchaeales archaeon]